MEHPAPDLPPGATNRPDIRYAWRGPSLLVVGPDGMCGAGSLTGFFFRQTRFLKDLRLRLDGEPPYPCSLAEVAPHELELTAVFPEVEAGDGGGSGSGGGLREDGLLFRDVDVRVGLRVNPASLDVTLRLASRWQRDLELDVGWLLSADFATVDEAQFDRPARAGSVETRAVPNGVVFRCAHPDLPLEARVRGGGADWRLEGRTLRARVVLPRQRETTLTLRVEAHDAADPMDGAEEARRMARQDAWRAAAVEVHAPAETPLVEIANRAAADLGAMALLEGRPDEWMVPGAGVPLYQSLWGRDALTTAWQAGILDGGAMLGDVLDRLARIQGRRIDPERDEEPGRMINQVKRDALTRLDGAGFDRSYADVASPFMFLIGLGYHYALTGDRARLDRHWDAALRILDWADRYGDRDGDGYIEYLTRSPYGPRHQGWKDSDNAIVDEHGRPVEPPIAPSEIQGYRYAATQFMAALSAARGQLARARRLWREAARLKERFNRDFWMDDVGCFAFGLDARKRPIRALTSNAAQCLPTGIVDAERIGPLVRRMFEPDLFSGWGIRTLSTGNPAYHPLDYHLGSVWPVENASILFGLRRYGQDDRVIELCRALYDLARLWPDGRTPECVGGYGRDEAAHPGAYPRANRPQTWNQSVWPIVVQCLTGIVPFAPLRLLMVDPILPPWLPELTVRRLRVGEASITIRFWRSATGRSRYEVLERYGTLHVVRQPWIESESARPWERLTSVVSSALPHRHRPRRADRRKLPLA